MEERSSRLLAQTCWTGCLIGAVATLYFLCGLAGYVRSAPLNFAVAAVPAGALGFSLYHFVTQPKGASWVGRSLWAGILILLAAAAILGFLPPTSRDELTHPPAISIIEMPSAPYADYPMLVDMLFTPWIHWGYDFVPKWIHLLFAAMTALLLYAHLARRMNEMYGWLGIFFFLSTPVVFRLGHSRGTDLALAFYTTAALLCLLRWSEERGANSWLALAALSLGFALAAKPNGLVAALLIALLFGLLVVRPPRRSFTAVSREILGFGALTLLPFLPWLIKNWTQTGNPLYPFFASVFAAQLTSGSAGPEGASLAGVGIFDERRQLYGETLWQVLALPLRVFFSGQDGNRQFFDGVLTPVLIVFLPWAFKGKWLVEKKQLGACALLLLLYGVFLGELRMRDIVMVVPPLVILFAYGVFNTYLSIKQPIVLGLVLLSFAAWHGVYAVKYFRAAAPLAYRAGAEPHSALFERSGTFFLLNQRPASKIAF